MNSVEKIKTFANSNQQVPNFPVEEMSYEGANPNIRGGAKKRRSKSRKSRKSRKSLKKVTKTRAHKRSASKRKSKKVVKKSKRGSK